METPAQVSLAAVSGWQTAMHQLFTADSSAEDLPARVVPLLFGVAPSAVATGCRLVISGASVTALADVAGRPLPRSDWPAGKRTTLSTPAGAMPALVVPFRAGNADSGEFLVAGPGVNSHDSELLVRLAAEAFGLRLQLAQEQKLAAHLRAERDELEALATVGEAVDGLTHEFSNILNSMMLQASVIALKVSEPLKAELAVIREQGGKATGLLRRLRQLRQRQRTVPAVADLNGIVHQLTSDPSPFGGRTAPALADGLPALSVNPVDLKRLVRCLVMNSLARQAGGDTPVALRTEPVGKGARLVLEDAGSPLPDTALETPLETGGAFDALEEHERLVVQTLLRRLGGRLKVANRTPTGLAVSVEWA